MATNHAYTFCETTPGTFYPFVKPRQVVSYLEVAITKICKTRD